MIYRVKKKRCVGAFGAQFFVLKEKKGKKRRRKGKEKTHFMMIWG